MSVQKIVYGIPTSQHFKWQLGRTGLSGAVKRAREDINEVLTALKSLEYYRAVGSLPAIYEMRNVRKACNRCINDFIFGPSEYEKDKITVLREALDARIDFVAAFLLGADKERDIAKFDARSEFDKFYDDVTVRLAGRKLDGHYRLERANSRHFPGGETSRWLGSSTTLGLNDWMDTIYKWQKQDGNSDVPEAPSGTVRYLTPAQRDGYRVNFRGGMAYEANGNALHTGNLVSSNAGRGWAIYVLGFDGQFYWGQHNVDRFHHSSFFAGAPVLAGGEIAINAGRVVGLTNKTGHYKARPEELSTVLQNLTLRLVDVAGIAVQDPFRAPNMWFRGGDALRADGVLTAATGATIAKPTVPE